MTSLGTANTYLSNPPALAHSHAGCGGVVQQQVVEGRPPYLVGMRILAVGLPEEPAPGFLVLTPDHGGAQLLDKSLGLDGRQDIEFLEDGDTGGKQGLAHVLAGKNLTFEKENLPALAGQHGSGGAAGGPAPDD